MSALQFLQRIGAINLPQDVLDAVSPPERPSYESVRAFVLEGIRRQIASAVAESNNLSARLEDERIKSDPNSAERIKNRIADLASHTAKLVSKLSDEDWLMRQTITEMDRQKSEPEEVAADVRAGVAAAVRARARAMLGLRHDYLKHANKQSLRFPVPGESHAQLVNKIAVLIDELVDDAVTRRLDEIKAGDYGTHD
jgi:hypothetical protein